MPDTNWNPSLGRTPASLLNGKYAGKNRMIFWDVRLLASTGQPPPAEKREARPPEPARLFEGAFAPNRTYRNKNGLNSVGVEVDGSGTHTVAID
jgi:hypothetical protein